MTHEVGHGGVAAEAISGNLTAMLYESGVDDVGAVDVNDAHSCRDF